MSDFWVHLLILVGGTLIAAFSQILLKTAAKKSYDTVIRQYLNVRVVAAYGMLLLSTFCSLVALRVVPLSFTPVADAAGQIFVVLLSFLILRERPGKRKLLGLGVIVAGMLIFLL